MRGPQRRVVDDVQHERVSEVEFPFERDFRDAPAGSPVYAPSGAALEWKAFVIVKRMPSTSTVPPLLNPTSASSPTPFCASQAQSSTIPSTFAPVFWWKLAAPLRWSPCPWVT